MGLYKIFKLGLENKFPTDTAHRIHRNICNYHEFDNGNKYSKRIASVVWLIIQFRTGIFMNFSFGFLNHQRISTIRDEMTDALSGM